MTTKHQPASPLPWQEDGGIGRRRVLEDFGRDASDLFKIAVNIAGFPAIDLARECFKRAPRRVTVSVVEKACGALLAKLGE